MTFLLRNAELEDSEAVVKLSAQFGYKSSEESLRNRLDGILSNGDNCVFVATINEEVIAWIHGFYAPRVESNPFAEIGGLVVDEHHRKEGVGRSLVEEVRKWADSKRCQKLRVRCNVVREETHVFYEKMGFDVVKEQKVFDMRIKELGVGRKS